MEYQPRSNERLNHIMKMASIQHNNKKEQFPRDEVAVSNFAKLLSHPARLAILDILSTSKSCICGKIVEVTPLSQSTVSQHLKVLKDSEIIQGSVEGTSSCYCLDTRELIKNSEALANFLQRIIQQAQSCCKVEE